MDGVAEGSQVVDPRSNTSLAHYYSVREAQLGEFFNMVYYFEMGAGVFIRFGERAGFIRFHFYIIIYIILLHKFFFLLDTV